MTEPTWCWICKVMERRRLARLLLGRRLTLLGYASRSGRSLYVCDDDECRKLAAEAQAFIGRGIREPSPPRTAA